MDELDRGAMGKRIRQIRLAAGLRQWELARSLGTTQSAVHKYEHGVVPEPRRLVELARIGGTSIEWVLTGQHWESGSESQTRLSPELLNTACMLREIGEDGRASVDEALRIIREAVRALEDDGAPGARPDPLSLVASLREHSPETLLLLESASRIQRAVMRRIAREAEGRLSRTDLGESGNGNREAAQDKTTSTTRR